MRDALIQYMKKPSCKCKRASSYIYYILKGTPFSGVLPLPYLLSRSVNPIATNLTINDATMLYTISANTAENSTTYCPANSVVGKMFLNGDNNGSEKS